MRKRNELTTISVSKKNHLKLIGMGKKGQSFDLILTELLEKARKASPQTVPGVRDSNGQSTETKVSTQTTEMARADEN